MRVLGVNFFAGNGGQRYSVRRIFATVSIISLLAVVPVQAALGTSSNCVWEIDNQMGQKAFALGKYELAQQKFSQALKEAQLAKAPWPRIAAVLTNLGACCREQQKYSDAEQYFERALAGKLDASMRSMILRHYGSLLQKTQRLGPVSRVVEPGVMRRWELESRQAANLVNNPLVLVDGVRSAYVLHGKLVTATDIYRQVQNYRREGLLTWAGALESQARRIFGASFERIWVAQAVLARHEAQALAYASAIEQRTNRYLARIMAAQEAAQRQLELAKKLQEEEIAQAEEVRLRQEAVIARAELANNGQLPLGALVQINVAPGNDVKVSQGPSCSDMSRVQSVTLLSSLKRAASCRVTKVGLISF